MNVKSASGNTWKAAVISDLQVTLLLKTEIQRNKK